jgi:hypothetical protein
MTIYQQALSPLTAFWMQTAVIRGVISAVCIQNAVSGKVVG